MSANDDPTADALLPLQETLCRMALLRSRSMSVNGAYIQQLPPAPERGQSDA